MFDFAGKRWAYFVISVLIVLPGAISLMIPPALKPGIEFTGGASFTLRFAQPVAQADLREALAELDHPEARVQSTEENEFLIRMGELEGVQPVDAETVGPQPAGEFQAIIDSLEQRFGPYAEGWLPERDSNLSSVSESVSSDIARNAVYAVLAAAAAISLYIVVAFRNVPKPWRYGACTVFALMHDVLFVIGLFSILGKVLDTEVDTAFIVAVLTVAGFSVHDTIVVFDRMREQYARDPDVSVEEAVNASLNETLARSVNTSITLVLVITALLLIGGETIRDFLIVLLAGTIAGTYSSIFIASQLLVTWEKRDIPRAFRKLTGRGEASLEPVEST